MNFIFQIYEEVNELVNWVEKQEGKPFDLLTGLHQMHANVAMSFLFSKRYVESYISNKPANSRYSIIAISKNSRDSKSS